MVTARQARHAPLSSHRAFVPLVALWASALVGGSLAVLPEPIRPDAAMIPITAMGKWGLVAAGSLLGLLAGWTAARMIAGVQRVVGRKHPNHARGPSNYVAHLIAENEAESMAAESVPDQRLQHIPRHGRAVELLRTRPTAELAMPQLVERFAVALDEHRYWQAFANREPARVPPQDMAFELFALRSQFHRSRMARS